TVGTFRNSAGPIRLCQSAETAWPDGAECLPQHLAQSARCGGCLPGYVSRFGPEIALDSAQRSSEQLAVPSGVSLGRQGTFECRPSTSLGKEGVHFAS